MVGKTRSRFKSIFEESERHLVSFTDEVLRLAWDCYQPTVDKGYTLGDLSDWYEFTQSRRRFIFEDYHNNKDEVFRTLVTTLLKGSRPRSLRRLADNLGPLDPFLGRFDPYKVACLNAEDKVLVGQIINRMKTAFGERSHKNGAYRAFLKDCIEGARVLLEGPGADLPSLIKRFNGRAENRWILANILGSKVGRMGAGPACQFMTELCVHEFSWPDPDNMNLYMNCGLIPERNQFLAFLTTDRLSALSGVKPMLLDKALRMLSSSGETLDMHTDVQNAQRKAWRRTHGLKERFSPMKETVPSLSQVDMLPSVQWGEKAGVGL